MDVNSTVYLTVVVGYAEKKVIKLTSDKTEGIVKASAFKIKDI